MRAAAMTRSTRAIACRSSLRSSTPTGSPTAPGRPSSRIRTVPPRPRSARCASAASRWSTCLLTSASTRDRYERWYGPHEAPELLDDAVYGLTEAHRDEIAGADLVAAPGCYPTAALLALWPLRDQLEDVVVDAKSGVSGAGREATLTTHFVSVTENVQAYKVEGHRHAAELEQELGEGTAFTFVPHLVPIEQGLLASCYATTGLDAQGVRERFEEAYADEPFIDLADEPPGTDDVRETNRCRIHVSVVGGRVIVLAAIDNLWKGAAGQAVQDLNLMLGLPETEGLE